MATRFWTEKGSRRNPSPTPWVAGEFQLKTGLTGCDTLPMQCVVTGGCGFIGSNLVDRLVQMGRRALVLDDLSAGSDNGPGQRSDGAYGLVIPRFLKMKAEGQPYGTQHRHRCRNVRQ